MSGDYCTVGIDCGGSKTECAIVDNHGRCLGVGRGGSSNVNYASLESVLESICESARLADEAAGPNRPPVRAIGGAVLRVRRGSEPDDPPSPQYLKVMEAEESLKRRFGTDIYYYYSEGEVGLGCIDVFDRRGIACIAGTGSSCFGMTSCEDRIIRGGWGAPLGDEGSAYDIAVQGIRAAGKALEGRGPATVLQDMVNEFFEQQVDGRFLRKIGPRIVSRRPEMARFAKMVSLAAEQGDEVAAGILDNAADELGKLALCGAKALFTPADTFPMVLHGGVFSNDRVANRAKEAILKEFPLARVEQSYHTPGVGAALLARSDVERGVEYTGPGRYCDF